MIKNVYNVIQTYLPFVFLIGAPVNQSVTTRSESNKYCESCLRFLLRFAIVTYAETLNSHAYRIRVDYREINDVFHFCLRQSNTTTCMKTHVANVTFARTVV